MIRSTGELYKKFPWMTDYPNMALYIIQFGMDDLIPIPWVARNTESAEKIYKDCVKKGKTWRELLDMPKSNMEGLIL